MKFLLDTNVIIDLMRGSDMNVFNHLSDSGIDECCICAETVFELYAGTYSCKRDVEAEIRRLNFMLNQIKILPTTNAMEESGRQKAILEKQGNIIEDIDIIIASTAKINNLVLVTSNTKHMERIKGLTVANWRD